MLSYEKNYNSIHQLAKAIDELPTNHDDRAEVIADMIKKFIHMEKYMSYKWALDLLAYGNLEIPKEYLQVKINTHKELMNKWCYNTYYSSRHYGRGTMEGTQVPTLMTHLATKMNATITVTTGS